MKRGRNQRRRQGGSNPNRALDSNGPDVRIRGTANQIYDKYTALARDASSAGDRVKAESYLQHAEHYFRVIRAMQPPQQQQTVDADGDQPSVAEGGENNGGERQGSERQAGERPTGERSGRGRGSRRRDETREQPKPAADEGGETEAVTEAAPEQSGNEDAEPKPKRRRTRRPAKAAASDADDAKKEAGEEAPAAAAE